ncbi:MAG TPA: ThiF family adenylyltransferase, partial [Planctomycetota bacterium]|nr:ThiF family adenylyltransferase [Planctomycetota bacterium]
MDRYSRQVLFKPIGPEGQKRLGRSRVAVVGCGALGSVSAGLLARAGVG